MNSFINMNLFCFVLEVKRLMVQAHHGKCQRGDSVIDGKLLPVMNTVLGNDSRDNLFEQHVGTIFYSLCPCHS